MNLLRLSEVNKMPDLQRVFLISQIPGVSVGPRSVRIFVPYDPYVAVNAESRKVLEGHNHDYWRWPAAGVGIIVKCLDANALLTVHRIAGAPSYPEHDAIASGLGQSERHFLYPTEVGWLEAVEEIIIRVRKSVVVPMPFCRDELREKINRTVREGVQLYPELAALHIREVEAENHRLRGEKDITIQFNEVYTTCSGLLAFDNATNGIDVLSAAVITLDCTLSELSIYDGEQDTLMDASGERPSGTPLNRPIHAYELTAGMRPTGKVIREWHSGELQQPKPNKVYKQAPVLRHLLAGLGG